MKWKIVREQRNKEIRKETTYERRGRWYKARNMGRDEGRIKRR